MAWLKQNEVSLESSSALTFEWSNTEDSFLAVGKISGAVDLFTESGEEADRAIVRRSKSVRVNVLRWHPRAMVLAVGFDDGSISLWTNSEKRQADAPALHTDEINDIQWDSEGDYLFTCCNGGLIGIWRIDARGRPSYEMKFEEEGSVQCLAIADSKQEDSIDDDDGSESALAFFYSTLRDSGGSSVRRADLAENREDVQVLEECSVSSLLYYREREAVVIMRDDGMVLMMEQGAQGGWRRSNSFRVPSSQTRATFESYWAGTRQLAVLAKGAPGGDSAARIFDLTADEVTRLQAESPNVGSACSISRTDALHTMLAVGYSYGFVVMFRRRFGKAKKMHDEKNLEDYWIAECTCEIPLKDRVQSLALSSGGGIVAALIAGRVFILHRKRFATRFREGTAAVQTTSKRVLVESKAGTDTAESNSQVLGIDATASLLITRVEGLVQVYSFASGGLLRRAASIKTNTKAAAIHGSSVYFAYPDGSVQAHSCSNGAWQSELPSSFNVGEAVAMDIRGNCLAIATSEGYVRLWRSLHKEAREFIPRRKIPGLDNGFKTISQIAVNEPGTRIAIISRHLGDEHFVTVFDVETASFSSTDMGSMRPEMLVFDESEPNVLAVEALHTEETEKPDRETLIYVVSQGGKLLLEERHEFENNLEGDWLLIGMNIPHVVSADVTKMSRGSRASTMRDFQGMQQVDDASKRAIIDFSYYLAVGDMERAFYSVRAVESQNVWLGMAKLCIKRRRADVAEVCLGNMGHLPAVRAARKLRQEEEEEELQRDKKQEDSRSQKWNLARAGLMAHHLGMLDDAQSLLEDAERYDILTKVLQSVGMWDKAKEIAQKNDIVRFNSIIYEQAMDSEERSDYVAAIKGYEEAGARTREIPRMLLSLERESELEDYIVNSSDNGSLLRWYGHYLESKSEMDRAINMFKQAGDILSQVRLYTYLGNFEEAEELVEESGDKASAFHLARQMEVQDEPKKATKLYCRADRQAHAVRIALDRGMEAEALSVALQGDASTMAEAASHFENRGNSDMATDLHWRSGNKQRAIDICIMEGLPETLAKFAKEATAEEIGEKNLERAARFLIEHDQTGQGLFLLIKAGKKAEAFKQVAENGADLSEETANALIPGEDDPQQSTTLHTLAKVAKDQGSYHLACKLYTKAGDRMKAIKSLIRSGDTERVIFYASASRNRDVYILAGNYLQALDWRGDEEIMKNIVKFYSKAKAYDKLADFYEAAAQAEIDEYRDYDRALANLREAEGNVGRARIDNKEERSKQLSHRVSLVQQFAEARQLMETDPERAISTCQSLLHLPFDSVDNSVRVGDIYALLVEHHLSQGDPLTAKGYVDTMMKREIDFKPYIEREIVRQAYTDAGFEPPRDAEQRDETPPWQEGVVEEGDDIAPAQDDDDDVPYGY